MMRCLVFILPSFPLSSLEQHLPSFLQKGAQDLRPLQACSLSTPPWVARVQLLRLSFERSQMHP
jgi:hypothetical protein